MDFGGVSNLFNFVINDDEEDQIVMFVVIEVFNYAVCVSAVENRD